MIWYCWKSFVLKKYLLIVKEGVWVLVGGGGVGWVLVGGSGGVCVVVGVGGWVGGGVEFVLEKWDCFGVFCFVIWRLGWWWN